MLQKNDEISSDQKPKMSPSVMVKQGFWHVNLHHLADYRGLSEVNTNVIEALAALQGIYSIADAMLITDKAKLWRQRPRIMMTN